MVLHGPPGYFWKLPNIAEMVTDLRLRTDSVRLYRFGYKAKDEDTKPRSMQTFRGEAYP